MSLTKQMFCSKDFPNNALFLFCVFHFLADEREKCPRLDLATGSQWKTMAPLSTNISIELGVWIEFDGFDVLSGQFVEEGEGGGLILI